MKSYNLEFYKESADYIRSRMSEKPEIGLVLGSALGSVAQQIENQIVIDYSEIPNFLVSTVDSHAGKLILGRLAGKNIIVMSGRFHFYEGYDFEELAAPVRVLRLLGVETLILTNAAGGINQSFNVGDIMVITDHIKLVAPNPTRGRNLPEFGQRFYDVSNLYNRELRALVKRVGTEIGQQDRLREGVYYYASGPSFETPAEIRAMAILGGDAVGMSTVTEALTAAHCGMKVIGLSLISNMAAGVVDQPVTAEEVNETGKEAAGRFIKLVTKIVEEL